MIHQMIRTKERSARKRDILQPSPTDSSILKQFLKKEENLKNNTQNTVSRHS